jgi:hypothetical protein
MVASEHSRLPSTYISVVINYELSEVKDGVLHLSMSSFFYVALLYMVLSGNLLNEQMNEQEDEQVSRALSLAQQVWEAAKSNYVESHNR